jgi:zinc protease
MKRTPLALSFVFLYACAGRQKPASAPSAQRAEPAAADPWASRTDLFVAPDSAPATAVELGAVERFTLPNGLSVIAVPRRSVPAIDVALAIKAGQSDDPLDKTGLADFTAAMLRKGTAKRTSDQVADAIDFVGGQLDANTDDDGTIVNCHARSKDLGVCLDLVGEVSTRPTFPEAEMAEIRDQLNAQVEQAKDSPNALANDHVANLFYGDDDPRGRSLTRRSVAAIDRKALEVFHKTWYAPNNAVLAVSGDFDPKALKAQLHKAFGGWKRHEVPKRAAHALRAGGPLRVRIVDKPDATQSTIVAAGPGISHASPDLYAVQLMNFTLGGGGFSSRLMKVVRSEGGKTYGAHSRFATGTDPGPFLVSTFTRNAETEHTLKLVLDEVEKMRKAGPTAEELKAAKGHMIGGYGLHLETGDDLAHALLGAELAGLDRDFVEKYPARLEAVTLADTARVAGQYLKPTALVVVGKAAEVKPLLAAAGLAVDDVLAYTAPASAAERAALAQKPVKDEPSFTPAEVAAGKHLLEQALAAKNGAALAKVKDLVLSGKGTMTMQGREVPVTVSEFLVPGKASREEISIGPLKIVQVVSGDKAFVKQGDKIMDLPPDMVSSMQRGLWRDPNFILLHAGQPGAKSRGLKPVSEKGAKYDVLEVVAPDGEITRVLLDAKTHLIARLVYSEEHKESVDELKDYAPEGGIAFPRKATRTGHGGEKLEISYDKIELNRGLGDNLFAK